MTCPAKAYQVDVEETACVRCPAKAYQVEVEKTACEMPRKSIPSRSRGNGLRGPVKAGVTGVFCTQQTQVSSSSKSPVAGFLGAVRVGVRTERRGLCPPCGECLRRMVGQCAVWPHLVVVLAPALELIAHIGEREE